MLANGKIDDGIYTIYPRGIEAFEVYCDMSNGGWTVIQRRVDSSVSFDRNYTEYVNGFGDLPGNMWLGLDKIHAITYAGVELKVTMESFNEGDSAYADYKLFSVDDAESGYVMTVSGYSGTAGNSLAHHNGRKFSSKDLDQDDHASYNCAAAHGAFWHGNCHHANPNGKYLAGHHKSLGDGVNWYHFKGYKYSLKTIEFKVRAKLA